MNDPNAGPSNENAAANDPNRAMNHPILAFNYSDGRRNYSKRRSNYVNGRLNYAGGGRKQRKAATRSRKGMDGGEDRPSEAEGEEGSLPKGPGAVHLVNGGALLGEAHALLAVNLRQLARHPKQAPRDIYGMVRPVDRARDFSVHLDPLPAAGTFPPFLVPLQCDSPRPSLGRIDLERSITRVSPSFLRRCAIA
jgi:hypothetical protein